jgi:diguanylate cyclase (GGDEF)-like protein/PAS domain S-box-containing protein
VTSGVHAPTSRSRLALASVIVLAAYFATAEIGVPLAFWHPALTDLWAPTAIALVAVLLWGYVMLPAVALAGVLWCATRAMPVAVVVGVPLAVTITAALAVALLRLFDFDPRLARVRDVIALAGFAGALAPLVGATIAAGSLRLGGVLTADRVLAGWRIWWLGALGGGIIIGGCLLVVVDAVRRRPPASRLAECLLSVAALAALSALLFAHDSPIAYLPFPILVLIALRSGQLGAGLGGFVVAGAGIWLTARGHGPFAGGSVPSALARAQTFADIATVTALLVAAARSERSVAEQALKRLESSERALAEAQRLTNIGSFEWDVVANRTTWSDELYRILGRDRDTYPATYASWLACVHEDDRVRVDQLVRHALRQGGGYSFQYRAVRGDGSLRTIECHGEVVVDRQSRPTAVHGTSQDITAFKLAEERFRDLLESAPDAMVISDDEGRIVLINSQTERMFGYSRSELIGAPVEQLVPPRVVGSRELGPRRPAEDVHQQPMGSGIDLFARRKDGTEFPVEITFGPLETEQGRLLSAAVRDVTERKLAADALSHQATHDPLTGLPNRTLFLDRLDHALARARRSRSKLAVLFLDLDDFKLVNDTRGHEAGDLLLVALTPRLSAALRPGDTVARFGGDEFVVLCEELVVDAAAMSIAERIADACARRIKIGDHEHGASVSIGVVIVDNGSSTPSDVLRDADAAMYRAKAGGKGRIELFDEGMRAQLIERIATESSLRRALEQGELRLFYQPVFSLERDELVGVEALLRWQHPHRGLLAPSEFISVAEESGLIVPIGEWVLDQACRQAVAWRDRGRGGDEPLRVSVNLSPRQVSRSNVVAAVQRVLRNTGLEPELLELEITEHTLIDEGESVTLALRELKEVGVGLVLDDFGTGYSSLSYLKRFTIDALKIDRSFVDGLGSPDSGDGAIVNAIVSMARALDVDVTAEGVETAEQLIQLRENGCPYAQGYLFSRPVPAEEIDALLGYGEPAPGSGADLREARA